MMNKEKAKIAVIMPAYNEATVISSVLGNLQNTLNRDKKLIFEIIVVNDGSIDETAETVKLISGVRLINHILNSGAGAATRTGMAYAKQLGFDYVITMDADGQHATDDVVKVAHYILESNVDFVIGSRLIEPAGMPWYRILGNKGLSVLTFFIFGTFVKDSQSGLRAFNREALEKVHFFGNHYDFCSEMIWSAKKEGLSITEIPIKAIYTSYSLSKGQSNWEAFTLIATLVKRRLLELINE